MSLKPTEQRMDFIKGIFNTLADPREVQDSTGNLISAYAVVRPFASLKGSAGTISLLGRVDRVVTNGALGERHTLVIGGVTIDLTKAASLSLDYQEQLPRASGPGAPSKTVFLHLIGRF